jgi:hypothetical protein
LGGINKTTTIQMIIIYSILLYLQQMQQIVCGNVYTQTEMDSVLIANQLSIQQIQNDPLLLEQITLQYDSAAQVVATTNSEIKF